MGPDSGPTWQHPHTSPAQKFDHTKPLRITSWRITMTTASMTLIYFFRVIQLRYVGNYLPKQVNVRFGTCTS
jgi:hypothetical protein